jgi:patatin-like phospholipase/acyl hydrolase
MVYRIISIDGGGAHGYASVILLKRLVAEYPALFKKVDLVAGTSIGGILGLGIADGNEIDRIEEHFLEGISYAFNTSWVQLALFTSGFYPKYDNSPFRRFLLGLFGKTRLGQLNKKVVITSFCLDNEEIINRRWKAKIFHNFEGSDSDGNERVIDVAMATSSAPVFFPTYKQYVDGAIIANNPAMVALTQTQDKRAKIENRPTLNEIKILSIGTIRNIHITERNAQWGYFHWARHLIHMLSEKDALVTNYQCKQLIGDNYHRMQPVINGPMDDFGDKDAIKAISMIYPIDDTLKWLKENW